MLIAEAAVAVAVVGPLELLALGLSGLAVVVAVGSALAAYGSRQARTLIDEQGDEP